ncbi:hypothetical protein [Leucobacter sp. USHLN153]|uniref:hypothetical protein n=1 Tax=Leucobacter sp. USHLN153 TaxID=3081268 RepID=UPI003018F4E3
MSERGTLEDAQAQLETWLRPAPGGADPETVLVTSIPPTAPLMRELHRALRVAADDINRTPEQRAQFRALLSGERSPDEVLRSGLLPIPDRDRLPADAQAIVSQLQEETP